jgi:tRNA-dihydrouridine synthase B
VSFTIPGDTILSPMDGYSDLPFRSLCRRLGSAMSYTEFINAIDVPERKKLRAEVARKIAFLPEERPMVFQIFDNDPDRILRAALRLREYEPDIIDVNMGCSATTVAGRGAGAGLLRTPHKIAEIFQKLTKALDVPVTGKIRLGWDDSSRNYLDIAKIIEDNGGALIAVHGRTKVQSYGGNADWDAIAEVVQAVSVPVIGNGDVRRMADIARMKAHTGCAAVMIGRAAIANPWIFARLDRDQVPPTLARQTMLSHLERNLEFYGEERGLVLFRKYAARYLSPLGLTREVRQRLLTCESPAVFRAMLADLVGQQQAVSLPQPARL